jgi:hypothetical protein
MVRADAVTGWDMRMWKLVTTQRSLAGPAVAEETPPYPDAVLLQVTVVPDRWLVCSWMVPRE